MNTPAPSTQDALALLCTDHGRLDRLFADYARAAAGGASGADRNALLERIGALLRTHAQVEEELFYPALGASADEIGRARREHAEALSLLERIAAGGGNADDLVARLAEAVRAHVAFEEQTLFDRASGLDLAELGSRMAVRHGEMLGEQGPD